MILSWIGIIIAVAQAITLKFDVQPGQQECLSDQLPANIFFFGSYQANQVLYTFTLSIVKENDEEIVLEEVQNKAKSEFHQVMSYNGDVQMCFEVFDYGETTSFTLNYDSGGEVHDFDQIAKKGHAFNMNDTLTEMESVQRAISREQNLIIDIESNRNKNFVDVSTKIIGFAGVTFGLLIIVAACQVIYIRRYVIYKKIM